MLMSSRVDAVKGYISGREKQKKDEKEINDGRFHAYHKQTSGKERALIDLLSRSSKLAESCIVESFFHLQHKALVIVTASNYACYMAGVLVTQHHIIS